MENYIDQTVHVLIPLTLFLIMVCVGLKLQFVDFERIFLFPKAVITGLVGQLVLMPVAGFLIAWFFIDNYILQIGIILHVACPGGPLSNSFVYLSGANVGLSVSLTALNSILSLFTTPFIASLGIALFINESTSIELPLLKTIAHIFMVAILPVGIGMFIRAKKGHAVENNDDKIKVFALLTLITHITLVVSSKFDKIIEHLSEAILPAIALCVISLLIGFFSGRAMGLDKDTQFTLSIEVCLQNIVLAILIANNILGRPEFALFGLTYAIGGVLLVALPWVFIYKFTRHFNSNTVSVQEM